MDLYEFCFALGGTGMAAMAVGALFRMGHRSQPGHGGRVGAGMRGGKHGNAVNAHARVAHHAAAPLRGAPTTYHAMGVVYALLSPRLFFALLVGFGAGGILGAPLGEPFRVAVAVLSAALFEGLLVGPLWRMLLRFESSPALTLETSVEDYARTVMDFDANSQGLVALEVDGQIVQILATLSPDERARGVRVRTGDVVRVSSVDAARNRCTVRLT